AGNGAKTGGGNDVAQKLRPGVGGRVVDGGEPRGGEVALELGCRGHGLATGDGDCCRLPKTDPGKEPEGPVAAIPNVRNVHRSTRISTFLVVPLLGTEGLRVR